MAQFILVYTHPSQGEERFELSPGRSYRIGSKPDNDIVIDQKDVSRRHAVLRVNGGSFHITDLDSKNGTFLNGAKIAAGSFGCGDMVHLSSARVVIVEVTTGSFTTGAEVIAGSGTEALTASEETQKYRGEASMEDVVTLLETTAKAVSKGTLTEPLTWAVDHLGFDGVVVLYRDDEGDVAMIANVGDLGEITRSTEVLSTLAADHSLSAEGTRVRQHVEDDIHLLVASVGERHVLVMRYSGRPPAISDLRSVIASVRAVLAGGAASGAAGTGRRTATVRGTDAEPARGDAAASLDPESLVDLELADARARVEAWMIRRALDACDGHQSDAARKLGLSRTGLFKKMRKLGF
jgi:hypothetical protein